MTSKYFRKTDFKQAESESKIAVNSDRQAVSVFLEQKEGQTKIAFERELRRLLFWLEAEEIKLEELNIIHAETYKSLLMNPPSSACNKKPVRYYTGHNKTQNPEWRPFRGPLSERSIVTAFNLINSFMNWLIKGLYISANPFSLVNPRKDHGNKNKAKTTLNPIDIENHFSVAEMYVIERFILHRYEITGLDEHVRWARALLIFVLMRRVGLRRHEAANITNKNIIPVTLPRSKKKINVVKIIGKGEKVDKTPVTEELTDAINLFKLAHTTARPHLPADNKDTHIITAIRNKKGVTGTYINTEIKWFFLEAAVAIEDGELSKIVDLSDVNIDSLKFNLQNASAHWLRHSAITAMAGTESDLMKLSSFARHKSIETTKIYVHTDTEEMSEALEAI